jgi:hypothetical protein
VYNQLHSAPGRSGYCPPPASDQWSLGLNEGYWCVQLTIEDGGPNDNDGMANTTIVDPGGVAVLLTANTMPVAQADMVRVKRNESLVIDVLVNDIDADGDILSIGVATATFGDVIITADNKLSYQSKTDFIGQDTIVYSLSDGNGGSDSGTVIIIVYPNEAPIALDDRAITNDRTAISINVLGNDRDGDGDSLTIVSATVDEGSVTINDDTTLRYTPDSGFSGISVITYTVDDGKGAQATARVTVDVEAYQRVTVNNKSKGGSIGLMIIALTGLVFYRLRRQRRVSKNCLLQGAAAVAVAASMNLAAAEPQWFVTGSIGKSQVKASYTPPASTAVNSVTRDDRDTSYSLGGGLRYVDVSFIFSYEQLGEATARYTGDVVNAEQFHRELANAGPKLAQGFSLQSQYTVWQGETLSASIGLGLLAWEVDYASTLSDSVISKNQSGTNLFYMAALAYPLTEKVRMSMQVTRYSLPINDVNNIALGLRYHF